MNRTARSLLLLLLASSALLACDSSSPSTPDSGARRDASAPVDAGPRSDAGPGSDAGPRPDASVPGEAELAATLREQMNAGHYPGLATCIIKAGEVRWCGAYGWANVAEERPVTPQTPFLLASISKLFTATATMQLIEQGLIGLDDDVDAATAFPLEHPDHPDTPITYRQLLAHAGSIADSDALGDWYATGTDPTISLAEAMEGYFNPSGRWYDATANFHAEAPGTFSDYSNAGYGLLGYLAQVRAGRDFAALTEERILGPLGMTRSSWRLADFGSRIAEMPAMPYGWSGSAYEPIGYYTFADYPNGGLFSSAEDMARFLLAFAGRGELGGTRILRSETVALMFEPAFPALDPEQGLGWGRIDIDGEEWVGHAGGEQGVSTDCYLRLRDGLGLVVLANAEDTVTGPIDTIVDALLAFAETL